MTHALSRTDKKVELMKNKDKVKAKEHIHICCSLSLDMFSYITFID